MSDVPTPTAEAVLPEKSRRIIAATVELLIAKTPGAAAKQLAYYERPDIAPRLDTYAAVKRDEIRAQLKAAGKCEDCGRPLSDPESIERGYGPDCVEKREAKARG